MNNPRPKTYQYTDPVPFAFGTPSERPMRNAQLEADRAKWSVSHSVFQRKGPVIKKYALTDFEQGETREYQFDTRGECRSEAMKLKNIQVRFESAYVVTYRDKKMWVKCNRVVAE